jgi:hypothetical protein
MPINQVIGIEPRHSARGTTVGSDLEVNPMSFGIKRLGRLFFFEFQLYSG